MSRGKQASIARCCTCNGQAAKCKGCKCARAGKPCFNCSALHCCNRQSSFAANQAQQSVASGDDHSVNRLLPSSNDDVHNRKRFTTLDDPSHDGNSARHTDNFINAYEEIKFWRPNLFRVPKCSAGTLFVDRLSHMYKDVTQNTSSFNNALYRACVFCQLLLQRPGCPKVSVLKKALERRLQMWDESKLNELMIEARA
ncbi:hypothetical protein GJ496_003811 [Pomphorhynchus laevis]|nr:hypothetical protein GJ496_003811 [Pomphorhynchus laevis]